MWNIFKAIFQLILPKRSIFFLDINPSIWSYQNSSFLLFCWKHMFPIDFSSRTSRCLPMSFSKAPYFTSCPDVWVLCVCVCYGMCAAISLYGSAHTHTYTLHSRCFRQSLSLSALEKSRWATFEYFRDLCLSTPRWHHRHHLWDLTDLISAQKQRQLRY